MSSTADVIRRGHADDGRYRVYTTAYCGYCLAAKRLLKQEGLDFDEIDVSGDDEARLALVQTTGQRTVPQIWHGPLWVGGYRELVPYVAGRKVLL